MGALRGRSLLFFCFVVGGGVGAASFVVDDNGDGDDDDNVPRVVGLLFCASSSRILMFPGPLPVLCQGVAGGHVV